MDTYLFNNITMTSTTIQNFKTKPQSTAFLEKTATAFYKGPLNPQKYIICAIGIYPNFPTE